MADQLTLGPLSSRTLIPEGHERCPHCSGSGTVCHEDDNPCAVCGGKGYWNADDIRDYHASYPHICRQECGEEHREPQRLS